MTKKEKPISVFQLATDAIKNLSCHDGMVEISIQGSDMMHNRAAALLIDMAYVFSLPDHIRPQIADLQKMQRIFGEDTLGQVKVPNRQNPRYDFTISRDREENITKLLFPLPNTGTATARAHLGRTLGAIQQFIVEGLQGYYAEVINKEDNRLYIAIQARDAQNAEIMTMALAEIGAAHGFNDCARSVKENDPPLALITPEVQQIILANEKVPGLPPH